MSSVLSFKPSIVDNNVVTNGDADDNNALVAVVINGDTDKEDPDNAPSDVVTVSVKLEKKNRQLELRAGSF